MAGEPNSPKGNMALQLDQAALVQWNNDMTNVTTMKLPRGTIVVEGFAASQHKYTERLHGGGWQVCALKRCAGVHRKRPNCHTFVK